MAGNLVGPLVGGILPQRIGIRNSFFLAGSVIFVSFLATVFLIHEDPRPAASASGAKRGWSSVADRRVVFLMLGLGLLTVVANMSIEPIITIFVGQLVPEGQVTIVSGVVISTAALGSIVSASYLGTLGDRVSHWVIISGCMAVAACLLVPQAYVVEAWQLIGLRFVMGIALGGLLPNITSVIRHNVPDGSAGSILGYLVTSQFAGQVVGPMVGGFVAGHFGVRAVFLTTATLLALGAVSACAMTPEAIRRPRGR
jgi:DHA1 family multidrug resistance protein-like MFS transporter